MKTENQYQPKTGQACFCKAGQQRDNCPACEGTGQRIDFAAIRARKVEPVSPYDQQAAQFLAQFGLTFRATLSDSKTPAWDDGGEYRPHYRVTISKPGKRLTFDFWGSINAGRTGEPLTAYSALACLSSDAYCPQTFADFCAGYGYEEDSRKAEQTFRRSDRFARRIREFFTMEELGALSNIQ
jgi:CDGSH-type Zn-finger protein